MTNAALAYAAVIKACEWGRYATNDANHVSIDQLSFSVWCIGHTAWFKNNV